MKSLDFCGLACPQPVLRCRDLLKEESPELITALVDNEPASINVNLFLERRGYGVRVEKKGDVWEITARRQREDSATQGEKAREGKRVVVLIPSEFLGSGDDALGKNLMHNFLLTLPEIGPELWQVILLNGGVKLAANPGPALDALKALAVSGVGVLVCGTCLNHFGLLEQKAVGETTNMLDIVTCMSVANMVIRP